MKWLNFVVAQMVKSLPAVWETRVRFLGREDPLEKEMATHSSILAWKIPIMEEPGSLQPMGSQRGGHDWATSLYETKVSSSCHCVGWLHIFLLWNLGWESKCFLKFCEKELSRIWQPARNFRSLHGLKLVAQPHSTSRSIGNAVLHCAGKADSWKYLARQL